MEKRKFIEVFYGASAEVIGGRKSAFFDFLNEKIIDESDHLLLKESLYKLDFWMSWEMMKKLKYKYGKYYGKSISLAFFGQLRELLFGYLILIHGIRKNKNKKLTAEITNILSHVFLDEMIGLGASGYKAMHTALLEIEEVFDEFLELRTGLDDNEEFLQFISSNMIKYFENALLFPPPFMGNDDLIWFRGLLKNLSYYNKRFIMPE